MFSYLFCQNVSIVNKPVVITHTKFLFCFYCFSHTTIKKNCSVYYAAPVNFTYFNITQVKLVDQGSLLSKTQNSLIIDFL